MGKAFGKAFGTIGLDERKCRWVSETRFQGFFWKLYIVFLPFSLASISLTESCSIRYGLKDLFTLHKLADSVVLDRQN